MSLRKHFTKLLTECYPDISEPKLSRKRKASTRFKVESGAYIYSQREDNDYRLIYFEALDMVVSAINDVLISRVLQRTRTWKRVSVLVNISELTQQDGRGKKTANLV